MTTNAVEKMDRSTWRAGVRGRGVAPYGHRSARTSADSIALARPGPRALGTRGERTEEHLVLRNDVDKESTSEDLVGASPALHAVLSRVAKVAPTDSTVLITGETGTGKELIARAIHRRSARAARPLVSVNCAATPPSLIASELFGHERGAFTGALQRRLGRFELAAGGTLFLDEVGELPPETQIALLRVLQEREFERVGGTQRDTRGRARRRSDQSRPRGGGRCGHVPERPLLPPQRVSHRGPAAARTERGHPPAGRVFLDRYAASSREADTEHQQDDARPPRSVPVAGQRS